MGEIITLQFGNFANYVGTHYWNIQEKNYDYCEANGIEHEIQSSLLWRSDETSNGTLKYTPRVMIVDLKDSKGALSIEGCIVREQTSSQVTTWDNTKMVTSTATRHVPSFDFTDLMETSPDEAPPSPQIENWSDFLGLDLHRSSIFECADYKFGIHAFDKFSDGQTFLENPQEVEEMEDKVRKLMEEASSPQGFQIFTNSYDGFGAVASGFLEKIDDEYSKPSITFGVAPSHFDPEGDDMHQMINTSLSMTGLSKASSVYVPIAMDWSFFSQRLKTHKEESYYHSSAVIAATMDTATLNYRSFSRTIDFTRALAILSPISEWNISSILSSFPFNLPPTTFSTPPVQQDAPPLVPLPLHPLVPLYTPDKMYGQLLSMRGTPKGMPLTDVRDILQTKCNLLPDRYSNCLVVSQPFEAPKTFPSLLYQKPFYPSSVVAQLQTTKAIYPYLSCLANSFKNLKSVTHQYPEVDYNEAYEDMYSLSEGYVG